MSEDVECPYCLEWQEINHDDGRGYEEDKTHEQECSDCGKAFVFTTSISYYYEAEKADCLNGGNHNYKITHTAPKEWSKMKCSMCDDERELTDEERVEHKIGTKESYFQSLKSK